MLPAFRNNQILLTSILSTVWKKAWIMKAIDLPIISFLRYGNTGTAQFIIYYLKVYITKEVIYCVFDSRAEYTSYPE